MFDSEQVRHVAKLARISLSDEEIAKFGPQLSNILKYVDILSEVDTEGVAETNQVTGLENVMDADVVLPSQSSTDELLDCSELPIDSKQIRVKRIV